MLLLCQSIDVLDILPESESIFFLFLKILKVVHINELEVVLKTEKSTKIKILHRLIFDDLGYWKNSTEPENLPDSH